MNLYVRFFAHCDDSRLGKIGLDFCDSLASTGIPIRLVPARIAEIQPDKYGRSVNSWDRHSKLLITPMIGDFVNCVCGTYEEWGRFYTRGVPNFLLVDCDSKEADDDKLTPEQTAKYAEISSKYDKIINVGTSPEQLAQIFTKAHRLPPSDNNEIAKEMR